MMGFKVSDIYFMFITSVNLSSLVPRWLGDESVRSGIKAQLLVDRCTEESNHLSQERCAMQLWMQEEWASLEHAIAGASKSHSLSSVNHT